jgi:hypothetical protein
MLFRRRSPRLRSSRENEAPRHRGRETKRLLHADGSLAPRTELDLVDLDGDITGRKTIKIGAKTTSTLPHVEAFLRKHHLAGHGRIATDATVIFYLKGARIPTDDIPRNASLLHYRVLQPDDDGSLHIKWDGVLSQLNEPQIRELEQDIQNGCTVGTLRESIMQLLQNSDVSGPYRVIHPYQIEIRALGGLRRGPLYGNNWLVQEVAAWLCRFLQVILWPSKRYFVFKGLNETYVWHSSEVDRHLHASGRRLRHWLVHGILTPILRQKYSLWELDTDDVRLTINGKRGGKRVRDESSVRAGQVMDFNLLRSVEDRYVAAESWLLPLSETCAVCGDDKRVSEMPQQITINCTHPTTTCKDCASQWIASSMDTVTWDRLRCPECPQILGYDDVRSLAKSFLFRR